MANKIQIKRGLKTKLPTLSIGEPAFCTDTKELFIGDGQGNTKIGGDTSALATQSANGLMSKEDKRKVDEGYNKVSISLGSGIVVGTG